MKGAQLLRGGAGVKADLSDVKACPGQYAALPSARIITATVGFPEPLTHRLETASGWVAFSAWNGFGPHLIVNTLARGHCPGQCSLCLPLLFFFLPFFVVNNCILTEKLQN